LDDDFAGKFPPNVKPQGRLSVPGIEPARDNVIPAAKRAKGNGSIASRDLAAFGLDSFGN
jgi:hypothetical protein